MDFVFIDWSNNVNYEYGITEGRPDFDIIEKTVPLIFQEWKSIDNSPKIAIMLGCPDEEESFLDGRFQKKVDQVYDMFIANNDYRNQYYLYLDKPLIMVYVGTPSPFRNGLPEWEEDDRFTFRYLTGYVSEQPNLTAGGGLSHFGYWSWEDRGLQTYTMHDGKPECCTISAASRAQEEDTPLHENHIPAEGRKNGDTFKKRWNRARELDVSTVLVISWNEWITAEQPSVEVSKDIEPSKELGRFYLDLLKEEIEKFKNE